MLTLMTLKVLLPSGVYLYQKDVGSIVVETHQGSLGFLPHRLDCITTLKPGILTYQTSNNIKAYVAIDEGVLIKTDFDVVVSVHNAIGGSNLNNLKELVEKEFLKLDEQNQNVRFVMAKMETSFIQRFAKMQHE